MQKSPCVPSSSGRLPGGGSARRAACECFLRPAVQSRRPRGHRPLSGRVHVLLFKVTAVLDHLSVDNGRERIGRWAGVVTSIPADQAAKVSAYVNEQRR